MNIFCAMIHQEDALLDWQLYHDQFQVFDARNIVRQVHPYNLSDLIYAQNGLTIVVEQALLQNR